MKLRSLLGCRRYTSRPAGLLRGSRRPPCHRPRLEVLEDRLPPGDVLPHFPDFVRNSLGNVAWNSDGWDNTTTLSRLPGRTLCGGADSPALGRRAGDNGFTSLAQITCGKDR